MKKLTIKNIILPSLLFGIFFIPFNSWSGIGFLGEYYRDSCFLFFSFAFILTLFKRRIQIPLQNLIFQFLILFLLWSFLTTLLNSHNIDDYYFKQTSGFSRFVNQFGSLIIASLIIPLTFYNGFKRINVNKTFRLIRRIVFASLIIVLIYSIIEILIVKFNMVYLKKSLLNLFDYFPFTEAKTDMRLRRISSVTFEPPALGTYLLSIAGWMFSYILTEKKALKYLPILIVLFLGFMSGSRAAFFTIIIQFIIAIFLLLKSKNATNNLYRILIGFSTIFILTIGYFNKPILVLDEFTSSLDEKNENLIFNEVAKNAFHSFIATFLLVVLGIIAACVAGLVIDKNFFTLLLSYCPGGIYEVAVIAIFFDLDPEFVSFHHIIRLLMILFIIPVILKIISKKT